MYQVLLSAATVLSAAEEGGAHEGTVWGFPPAYFGIAFGVLFFIMFLVTISFSGRGIIREEHSTSRLDSDETQAINEYHTKRGH